MSPPLASRSPTVLVPLVVVLLVDIVVVVWGSVLAIGLLAVFPLVLTGIGSLVDSVDRCGNHSSDQSL